MERCLKLLVTEARSAGEFGGTRRLAWSGLTAEELKRPGGTLLALLVKEANRRGLQMKEMAEELGVTYGYIAQLRGGIREVRHISEEFVHACARFLGVAPIAVKIAAGKITARDFLQPDEDCDSRIDNALAHIQADPLLGGWMPPNVFQLDRKTKQFVILCYQQATGMEIIPHRMLPGLMHDLQNAVIVQEDFEQI